MHCHCGTNNRASRWTFTDPCKPEVRPGCPGGVRVSCLASSSRHECPRHNVKWIYGGLTLDVDRHYIGSVPTTTHQEKGIIALESNPSRGTVIPALHDKGNKCDKNVNTKELMHCHCGTNSRAPRWIFTYTCNSEVRPGASFKNDVSILEKSLF